MRLFSFTIQVKHQIKRNSLSLSLVCTRHRRWSSRSKERKTKTNQHFFSRIHLSARRRCFDHYHRYCSLRKRLGSNPFRLRREEIGGRRAFLQRQIQRQMNTRRTLHRTRPTTTTTFLRQRWTDLAELRGDLVRSSIDQKLGGTEQIHDRAVPRAMIGLERNTWREWREESRLE